MVLMRCRTLAVLPFVLALACQPHSVAADHGARDFMATAYTNEGKTATERQTRPGIVAADPDVLPLGSRIQVEGAGAYSGEYVVEDTGRKITGREIDIYIPRDAEAKKFGRRKVRVRILDQRRPDARPVGKERTP